MWTQTAGWCASSRGRHLHRFLVWTACRRLKMAVSTVATTKDVKKLDPRIERLLQLLLEAQRQRKPAKVARKQD